MIAEFLEKDTLPEARLCGERSEALWRSVKSFMAFQPRVHEDFTHRRADNCIDELAGTAHA